jgi:hypothetical protein
MERVFSATFISRKVTGPGGHGVDAPLALALASLEDD